MNRIEHSGAKRGRGGYYGRKAEAKAWSRSQRRRQAAAQVVAGVGQAVLAGAGTPLAPANRDAVAPAIAEPASTRPANPLPQHN